MSMDTPPAKNEVGRFRFEEVRADVRQVPQRGVPNKVTGASRGDQRERHVGISWENIW